MSEWKGDAKEVKEVLEVVSSEIPKLLEAISSAMYTKENAENLGKAVANFYKQMKDAGMDEDQAYELTEKFMRNFSIGGMIGQVFQGGVNMGHDHDLDHKLDDLDHKLEKKIRRRTAKELDDDEEDEEEDEDEDEE